MKTTAKRHARIGLGMLAALASVNLAAATPEAEKPRSIVVRYADLDPSRPEDARRLYGRIKRAARAVCFNDPASNLERLIVYEECLGRAMTEAVEKVQSEQVSAILHARN